MILRALIPSVQSPRIKGYFAAQKQENKTQGLQATHTHKNAGIRDEWEVYSQIILGQYKHCTNVPRLGSSSGLQNFFLFFFLFCLRSENNPHELKPAKFLWYVEIGRDFRSRWSTPSIKRKKRVSLTASRLHPMSWNHLCSSHVKYRSHFFDSCRYSNMVKLTRFMIKYGLLWVLNKILWYQRSIRYLTPPLTH